MNLIIANQKEIEEKEAKLLNYITQGVTHWFEPRTRGE